MKVNWEIGAANEIQLMKFLTTWEFLKFWLYRAITFRKFRSSNARYEAVADTEVSNLSVCYKILCKVRVGT